QDRDPRPGPTRGLRPRRQPQLASVRPHSLRPAPPMAYLTHVIDPPPPIRNLPAGPLIGPEVPPEPLLPAGAACGFRASRGGAGARRADAVQPDLQRWSTGRERRPRRGYGAGSRCGWWMRTPPSLRG